MPEVSVQIAGRNYRMACDEGQEAHLRSLGALVDSRIGQMRASFGEIGDMRLTVMAAIVVADELSETRRRVEALEADVARMKGADSRADEAKAQAEKQAAEAIDRLARRLENVAGDLAEVARRGE